MRVVFVLLTIMAALLTILIVGLIILSISVGGGTVLLSGLGLVVALPLIITLLVVFDAALIACALLARRFGGKKSPRSLPAAG